MAAFSLCAAVFANVPSGAQAAVKHTLKVVGIDRNGATVKVRATVLNAKTGEIYMDDGVIMSGGSPLRVPTGRYEIAAPVPTGSTSTTLVGRFAWVDRDRMVRLDARAGNLLQVALSDAASTPSELHQGASICLGSTWAVGTGGAPGSVYVAPIQSKRFPFSYSSAWQDASGAYYHLTGTDSTGMPSDPSYQVSATTLDPVAVAARTGTSPTNSAYWQIEPGALGGCRWPLLDTHQVSLPIAFTDYRTPGSWSSELDLYNSQGQFYSFWYLAKHYRSGRSYYETYNRAVRAPALSYPEIQGDFLDYSPTGFFNDPTLKGFECCSKSVVTLRFRGAVLKRAYLTDYQSQADFTKYVHQKGWYHLQVSARRYNPDVPIVLGSILSPRVTLNWRFHITPGPQAGYWQAMPVILARFIPRGLDSANSAAVGAVTPVAFHIRRAPSKDLPTPKYPWQKVVVKASVDDGATWQTVPVQRTGNNGVASVQNPTSAGYVWLRIIVVDTHGDRTVETIQRAYSVN